MGKGGELVLKSICVFCGSGLGNDSRYQEAAVELGSLLSKEGITLVYGGGKVGIMGCLARAVMSTGGQVIGVIPEFLFEKEVAFKDVTELRVVKSMHERKAAMAELSDGFIALPGGFGTLEELIEVTTWLQLGLHQKPCGVMNVIGFFDPLFIMLNLMSREGFIHPDHFAMLLNESDPHNLIEKMRQFQSAKVDKADWALGDVAGTS